MRWLFHSAHKDVYIRLKVHSRYRTVGLDTTLATLWVFLEMISSANHLSDTSKTKYNHVIQPSDNEPKQQLMNTINMCKTKPGSDRRNAIKSAIQCSTSTKQHYLASSSLSPVFCVQIPGSQ